MKFIDNIRERYKKRNKLFLSLDALFTLLTFYFALQILFVIIPVLSEPSQSSDSTPLLLAWMTLSLGLTYLVRVVEMLVTEKRNYLAMTSVAAIIVLGIATLEFYWLV
ncbi:hypothetical protein [Lentibacillus salicampi]|uniref:Uncharacterized protein n=1 Tax=Lentibacillus salicampi TaxID=175306 RepID=A0A4Y9AA63_9BACI|nr:hypothetical protein [Lentibacillus salicampi]TFJ91244.1 hypothetical protein E4U82_18725 [Lentibacillus salicampi]